MPRLVRRLFAGSARAAVLPSRDELLHPGVQVLREIKNSIIKDFFQHMTMMILQVKRLRNAMSI